MKIYKSVLTLSMIFASLLPGMKKHIKIKSAIEILLSQQNGFISNPLAAPDLKGYFGESEEKIKSSYRTLISYLIEKNKHCRAEKKEIDLLKTAHLKEKITYHELDTIQRLYLLQLSTITQHIHDSPLCSSILSQCLIQSFHEKLFATTHPNPFVKEPDSLSLLRALPPSLITKRKHTDILHSLEKKEFLSGADLYHAFTLLKDAQKAITGTSSP